MEDFFTMAHMIPVGDVSGLGVMILSFPLSR